MVSAVVTVNCAPATSASCTSAAFAIAEPFCSSNSPALMVVVPELVFVPEYINFPAPAFITLEPPLMLPLKVRSLAVLPIVLSKGNVISPA